MRKFDFKTSAVTRKVAVLTGVCLASLLAASAANATVDISGSFTDSVSGWTGPAGDGPIIENAGGLSTDFSVSGLTVNGSLGTANSDSSGLLFTVDPGNCPGCKGTYMADIHVTFTFGAESFTDIAVATFNYAKGTDSLCWGAATGSAVVSSTLKNGACGGPGTGTPKNGFAYQQVVMNFGGTQYDVDLYDWNDWDMQPEIKFGDAGPMTSVPEPLTLSLFGAGLAGAAALRRRRKQR